LKNSVCDRAGAIRKYSTFRIALGLTIVAWGRVSAPLENHRNERRRSFSTESDSIRACPIILQREIRKKYDVRVTVVGETVFAATIDSQSDSATEVDWRKTSQPTLAHAIYHLPPEIAAICVSLTRKLGLRYGAIDLILDCDDQLWFLEINPNGQWGWIETRTGHPIAAAIVSEMEKISNG